MKTSDALDAGNEFLGAGYIEPKPGSGRFVSEYGTHISYNRIVSDTTAEDIDFLDELLRSGRMTIKKRKKVISLSECIICCGNSECLLDENIEINEVDPFLMKGAVWIDKISKDIWTFRYQEKQIDAIITEAQAQMHETVLYEETLIYRILNLLIDNHISFAMWYDIYMDDLNVCKSREDVLKTCYEQIMDKSGLCEVYIVSKFQDNLFENVHHN